MLDHFLQKNLCKCYYTIVRLAELNYTFDYTKTQASQNMVTLQGVLVAQLISLKRMLQNYF